MRGLAYWYLSATWGNVPILENPSALVDNFIVNSNPFEHVLQYAIRDMEYAAEWLPETDVAGKVSKMKGLLLLPFRFPAQVVKKSGRSFPPVFQTYLASTMCI